MQQIYVFKIKMQGFFQLTHYKMEVCETIFFILLHPKNEFLLGTYIITATYKYVQFR